MDLSKTFFAVNVFNITVGYINLLIAYKYPGRRINAYWVNLYGWAFTMFTIGLVPIEPKVAAIFLFNLLLQNVFIVTAWIPKKRP